jgi:hypothetical protein
MSPAPQHRRRLWRATGRQLGRAALTIAGLRLGAVVVGPFTTAAIAAVLFTVGAVAWWARVVEPRVFAPRRPSTPPARLDRAPAAERARHLAFAQALAEVAARYLDECEQEARR